MDGILYRARNDSRIRVTVYANGCAGDGHAIIVPSEWNVFLERAGRKLGIENAKFVFDRSGLRINGFPDLKPNAILFLSDIDKWEHPSEAAAQQRYDQLKRAAEQARERAYQQQRAADERRRELEDNVVRLSINPEQFKNYATAQRLEVEQLRQTLPKESLHGSQHQTPSLLHEDQKHLTHFFQESFALPHRLRVDLAARLSADERVMLRLAGRPQGISICFVFPVRYPAVPVVSEVRPMGGDFLEKDARYSFEERATLQSLLESEAIARVGHAMISDLVQKAQTWIDQHAAATLSNLRMQQIQKAEQLSHAPSNMRELCAQLRLLSGAEVDVFKDLLGSHYSVCTSEEIRAKQQAEITSLVNLFLEKKKDSAVTIDLPSASLLARVSLSQNHWKGEVVKKKFSEDSHGNIVAFAIALGLLKSPPASQNLSLVPSDLSMDTVASRIRCPSCLDDFFVERMTSVGCGHFFCNKCWREYLNMRINEARTDVYCPAVDCKYAVDDALVSSLVDFDSYAKYLKFSQRSFLESQPNRYVWCPAATCSNAIRLDERISDSVDVLCDCGHAFCSKCKRDAHWPLNCEQMDWWLERAEHLMNAYTADHRTKEWLDRCTKPCPHCRALIQKDGGCNHVLCSRCRFSFCWTCLRAWYDEEAQAVNHGQCQAQYMLRLAGRTKKHDRHAVNRHASLQNNYWRDSYFQLYVQQQRSQSDDFRTASLLRVRMELALRARGSLADISVMQRLVSLLLRCRSFLVTTCKLGYYHSLRERSNTPSSNKRLRHAISNLDCALALVGDVVAAPKLKPDELLNSEQITRRAFTAFRDDINQVLVQFLRGPEKDLDPGTEILVRRSPQVGGKGKRIPKPDSYEDLLRAGGAALGIKAVIARDANEYPLQEDELIGLPQDAVIHLYTSDEEN